MGVVFAESRRRWRMLARVLIALGLALACAPLAYAQDTADDQLLADSTEATETADEAWRAIAELLGDGRFEDAEVALRGFRSEHPEDERGALANALATAIRAALERPSEEVQVTS